MTSIESTELYQFLWQHKVEKGQNYTHTSIGKPAGSYFIPSEKKDQLIDLLDQTVFDQGIAVHLTEKPEQHSLIKIDLDFKFDLDQMGHRKYTLEHVRGMVELYHRAIKTYLDVPNEKLQAFVFERDAPYKDRGNCKDGIHIMYPFIICDTAIQHLMRDHVLLSCQTILSQIQCKNNFDDIVDDRVISTNNWLMYGCSKPCAKPYHLTHIFDYEYNDLNLKKYNSDNKSLIKLLSIRDHDIQASIPIKEEHKYLLEKRTAEPRIKRVIKIKRFPASSRLHSRDDYNLEEVRELANLLSNTRAEPYNTWMEVGLCLHNIDNSLLDSWIRFSRKSSKFKEGECDEVWSRMETKEEGLGIGSLHRWAQLDHPDGYKKIRSTNIDKSILKSQSQTTQDVARVVYDMYKHEYVCTSLKQNLWYEFRNHRWEKIESGITLKKRIGNEVVNEYIRMINYYNQSAYDQQDDQKDIYLQKAKNLTDITYKLRDHPFKEKIMSECKVMFYDGKFESLLDSNPDLIGFNNGVYDLQTSEFRDGRPEDYISLSTEIDYDEFSDEDEKIQAVYKFVSQVFPQEDVRDYVLILLASFLEGRNPNEKFHIWTGMGGNGKSKLLELFELAFGRYGAKIPVSLLTEKARTASSAANPEIARLKGVRCASAQEPSDDVGLNTGIVKDLTGGDKIPCRALYSEPFDFKPQFKIIFCCNNLPKISADDDGIWRRISVTEFKCRFIDNPDPHNPFEFPRDRHLTEKLQVWKEAFMYILLQHYKIYRRNGLQEPLAVKEATSDYQKTNDIYRDFIGDCFEPCRELNSCAKLEEVFHTFKDWWKENYSGKTPSRKDMKACMEKKLNQKYPKGGWRGWKLLTNEERQSTVTKETVIATGPIGPIGPAFEETK